MKALLILASALFLSGCAVGMKQHGRVFVSSESKEARAKKIFNIALQCWSRRDYLLYAGTVVENRFTLDGISIEAKWATWRTSPTSFMHIFVRDDPNGSSGSKVEIFQPARVWLGFGSYWEDATRWAEGDYTCDT